MALSSYSAGLATWRGSRRTMRSNAPRSDPAGPSRWWRHRYWERRHREAAEPPRRCHRRVGERCRPNARPPRRRGRGRGREPGAAEELRRLAPRRRRGSAAPRRARALRASRLALFLHCGGDAERRTMSRTALWLMTTSVGGVGRLDETGNAVRAATPQSGIPHEKPRRRPIVPREQGRPEADAGDARGANPRAGGPPVGEAVDEAGRSRRRRARRGTHGAGNDVRRTRRR